MSHLHRYRVWVLLFVLVLFTASLQAQTGELIKKIYGSDTTASDIFGRSVAMYGDTAVVGGRFNDTDGVNAGAVYIFRRHGDGENQWGQTKRLSSPGGAGSWFGQAVDIHRDLIIVGAKNEARAYIYFRHAGGMNNWGLVKTLAPPSFNGEYGHEVVVYEDFAVVSEIWNSDFERVYIYHRNHGGTNNWGLVKTLVNEDPYTEAADLYGYDIAMHGDILAVAENDLITPTGVHIYYRNEGGPDNWGLVQRFDYFDDTLAFMFHSVDVYGDTIVCGSRDLDVAFILQKDQGGTDNWGIVEKITVDDLLGLGQSVSIWENSILIGEILHGEGSIAVKNGFEPGTGAVHWYTRSHEGANDWAFQDILIPPDPPVDQRFGVSVDQSFNLKTVIGAYLDEDRGFTAGAAYIYSLGQDTGTVKVNLFPKDAVGKGAKWRFTFSAPDNWRPDGDASHGNRGNCYIVFKDVEGYQTPGRIKLTVNGGDFIELDVTYEKKATPKGRLWVRLFPYEVRKLDARWRIMGSDNWYPSDSEIHLEPGTYRVQSEAVHGYETPEIRTVVVQSKAKTVERIRYTVAPEAKGQLRVELRPDSAVAAGALWRVGNSDTWHESGTTLNLAPGLYTVEFKSVNGHTTPEKATAAVVSEKTTILRIEYQQE